MVNDDGLALLQQIGHIVVLMMENRSFDHTLGHLSLDGMADVNGLTSPGINFNVDPNGNKIGITAFDADAQRIQRHGEALQKKSTPTTHGTTSRRSPATATATSPTAASSRRSSTAARPRTTSGPTCGWCTTRPATSTTLRPRTSPSSTARRSASSPRPQRH